MDITASLQSLSGGALIGLGATVLLAFHGRVAGISGIVGTLMKRPRGDMAWRAAFVAGLFVGGLVIQQVAPAALASGLDRSPYAIAVAGLLVGFGTRLGSGCTSGHGICGLTRGSPRSLVATLSFMGAGGVSAFVVGHLLGGVL